MHDDVSALILAGGESRRFGGDKARFHIDGRPMIERVFEVVRAVAAPVRISVGEQTQPYVLPAEHVLDQMPNTGPLGGLHTGLLRSEEPWLLVVACDLPFVTIDVLAMLLDAREAGTDAVVAETPDGCRHPHCACYNRRVLARVAQQIEDGRLALHALLDRLDDVRTVTVPHAPLQNVNYRRDIDHATP